MIARSLPFFQPFYRWSSFACVGIFAILLSAVAGASDPAPQPPCKGGEGPPHGKFRHGGRNMGVDFKTLDADGDGFLSFEEFSQSPRLARIDVKKRRKLFNYLDRDKDGKLRMRELRHQPPQYMQALRKDFERLDVDGSGGFDFLEFSKAPQLPKMNEAKLRLMFKRLDRNKDGHIQRSELKGRFRPGGGNGPHHIDLKKYDVNSSGGLDFEEFSKLPWLGRIPEGRKKKLFQKLDQDNNGEVSPEEVRAVWADRRKSGPPHRAMPNSEKRSHHKPSGRGGPPTHRRRGESEDSDSPQVEL